MYMYVHIYTGSSESANLSRDNNAMQALILLYYYNVCS